MTDRAAHDRCPGVFDPHPAADGALVRVRLPGGTIEPAQMEALAAASTEHGDGFLELTSRANVQLRGVTDVGAVAAALAAVGLVPSMTHEKVRNVIVSALTGRRGGLADVRAAARQLDSALRVDPALAGLSGRFLFGIDDGHGDVVAHRPDVCAVVRPGGTTDILIDGTPAGAVNDLASIAAALVGVAADMVAEAPSSAWRVRDLDPDTRTRLIGAARGRLDAPVGSPVPDSPAPGPSPDPLVGWLVQDDGRVLLGGVVAAGRLPSRLAQFLAAIDAPIVLTPEREVLICDLTEDVAETVVRVLAPMGLIFDASSPWVSVSCCAGAPACRRGYAPVREDLRIHIESGVDIEGREHWVGCERGCGSPTGAHLRVQAGPHGYVRTPRQ